MIKFVIFLFSVLLRSAFMGVRPIFYIGTNQMIIIQCASPVFGYKLHHQYLNVRYLDCITNICIDVIQTKWKNLNARYSY